MATPVSVLLDTDIGSDIDDALALLLLLRLTEADLVGITTVYGDVDLRAKVARRILQAAGRNCPVHAGSGQPMSSPLPVWHTNLEGIGVLSDEDMSAPLAACDVLENSSKFIAEAAARFPGQLTVVAIGALTNIAIALEEHPQIVEAVKEIVFMGAGLTYPIEIPREIEPGTVCVAKASHNVRCDTEAARRVFASEVPIRVLTNDVTTQVWWEGESVERLVSASEPPEAAVVGSMLKVWLEYRTGVFNRPVLGTCPHASAHRQRSCLSR